MVAERRSRRVSLLRRRLMAVARWRLLVAGRRRLVARRRGCPPRIAWLLRLTGALLWYSVRLLTLLPLRLLRWSPPLLVGHDRSPRSLHCANYLTFE